ESLGYFASIGYSTQEGILIGNQFNRLNASLSLNSKISERLSATLNLNYINTQDDRLNENQDLGNPLQALLLPASDTYNADNDFVLNVRSLDYNPLTEVNFASFDVTNNSLLGSLGLKYQLNDQLTFDVNGGTDLSEITSDRFSGSQTQDGAGTTGRTRISTESVVNRVFNGWLTYTGDQSSSNKLSVILGASYQDSKASFTFSDSSFPDTSIPGGAFSFLSSYSRITYAINDQYDFQVSGRMDATSKFDTKNRVGFFPAVSGGWKINNASFFNVEPVNLLKLRASFGLVGNTPQDDFLYRQNYFRSARYGNEATVEPANLSNEDIKWETTSQINVGLDFELLDSRISASVDYYVKSTKDLLYPINLAPSSGFSGYLGNVGEMENKGFEFNLSTVNVETPDFSWTTDFNISSNKNTIKELNNLPPQIVGVNAFIEGESAGVFYMQEYAGVDFETGDAIYFVNESSEDIILAAQQVSDASGYRISERFGDRYVTTDWNNAQRTVVGDPNPELFGGITNSLAYKNFEFSFMFQFVSGVDLYFQTGEFLSNSGILNLGQTSDQVNRWYKPGDETDIPRLDPTNNVPLSSTRWLSDGDYIRLKNITFTYNLPSNRLEKLGLRSLSFYVSASNLLTFTDYIGFDPDVSYFDPLDGVIGQNISRGIDNFNTPQPRIIMTGIKIGL
ncbi:MAG: SusC/RagA family TonB-linked outer membrane protein, partial [Ekhidna sp.]